MAVYSVTVTWMDGTQENYPVANYFVADGELVLIENDSYAKRNDTRHIPLANVRVWKAERR